MGLLDLSIESAESGSVVRAPISNLKVRKNGKPAKEVSTIRKTEIPSVGDEIVRVINECDPVGFLSDIIQGKAIQCHIVLEDGSVQTIYETPALNKRIEVAKFLVERYLPKVAVVKHAHLHKDMTAGKPDTKTNFEQMVTHAAGQSSSDE